MELIFNLYALFCVTTALVGQFQILNHVLAQLDEEDLVKGQPMVARVTFFVLALLFAPVVFLCVIFPEARERFITGMLNALNEG